MSIQPSQHPLAKNFPIISIEVKEGNFGKLVSLMKTLTMFENPQVVQTQPKLCAKFIPSLEIVMDRQPDLLELISKVVLVFKKRGIFALEEAVTLAEERKLILMNCKDGNVLINTSIFRLCNAYYRQLLVPGMKAVDMKTYSKRTVEIVKAWITTGVLIIKEESLSVAAEVYQLAGVIGEPLLQEEIKKRLTEIAENIKVETTLLDFDEAHKKYFSQLDLGKVAVRGFLLNKGIKFGNDLIMQFEDLMSFENEYSLQQILMKYVSICFDSEESMESSLLHFLNPAPFQNISSVTYILPRESSRSQQIFFDQCIEHYCMLREKLLCLTKGVIIVPEPTVGKERDHAAILKETQSKFTQTSCRPVVGFTLRFFSAYFQYNADKIESGSLQKVGIIHVRHTGEMVFKGLKE